MIFAPETKKFDFEVQYSTFVEKEKGLLRNEKS